MTLSSQPSDPRDPSGPLDAPTVRLLRAIFPEVDPHVVDPMETLRSVLDARERHHGCLDSSSPEALPAGWLVEERLDVDRQVELLYRSVAGGLRFEPRPVSVDGPIVASAGPIVSALRRLRGLPGLPSLDPLAVAIRQREAGTCLQLYRLALEEARLLDQDLDEPDHLDLMGLHLEDPAIPALPSLSEASWKLLQYQVAVYRGIQRARCDDFEGARRACAWIAGQPLPHDPLLLSAVAELKARFALFQGSTADIVQPLIMSSIVLQDEPDLQPRLAELALLRLEIHEERGETDLAAKTRRWLNPLVHHLDARTFPQLARRVELALGSRPRPEGPIGLEGKPIVE